MTLLYKHYTITGTVDEILEFIERMEQPVLQSNVDFDLMKLFNLEGEKQWVTGILHTWFFLLFGLF